MQTQNISINNDVAKRFKEIEQNATKLGIDLHLIPQLEVDYSTPVEEGVADSYLPHQGIGKVKEDIILMSFPGIGKQGEGEYFDRAVAWAQQNGLRKTTPHVLIGLANLNPDFHYEINNWPNKLFLETAGCLYQNVLIAFYGLCHFRFAMQVGCGNVKAFSEDGISFPDFKSWFMFRF